MCGIVGYLERNATEIEWTESLSRMAHSILHRGPDDGGIWYDAEAGVGLGNRRLAIVDLSPHGHQPMISSSDRFVITFNGEIYNHLGLRAELEHAGTPLHFRGHSDTEVILACIERWGILETLTRSVGMFGLAVWDRHERELTIARDRLGEKPLYYGWQDGRFFFCSELKSLTAHPQFRGTINRDALGIFVRHRYIPTPYSIFDGIRKLPAGTMLTLGTAEVQTRTSPQPHAYWSIRNAAVSGLNKPFAGSEEDAVDHLDALLRDAVRSQMVADVPLGALLSGGIDSSAIVALMQRQSQSAVRTFTIGSPDAQYDESSQAQAVAHHLGADHTELVVTADEARSVIPRLATIYDEPFADPSQVPTLLVCQLARKSVTVALSGDGGDELFGGYSRHFWIPEIWERIDRLPHSIRRAAATALTTVSPDTWTRAFEVFDPVLPARMKQRSPGDKLHKLAPLLVASDTNGLYRSLVSHWDGNELVIGARTLLSNETDPQVVPPMDDLAQRMMFIDMISFLPDDVLAKVDRASMAVSLETRAPFLDHRVVEFAWSLPLSLKIRDGKGKYLLRQVLNRYVPELLIDRPKSGFGVPIGSWLRGPLKDWAEDLLSEQRLRDEGFFRPEPIRTKWREHLSGRKNWQHFLWDVLMFEAWWDAFRQTDHHETQLNFAVQGGRDEQTFA